MTQIKKTFYSNIFLRINVTGRLNVPFLIQYLHKSDVLTLSFVSSTEYLTVYTTYVVCKYLDRDL